MRDFTTKECIEPIVNLYLSAFTPNKDKAVLEYLNCDALLTHKKSNQVMIIRRNNVDYPELITIPLRELYSQIERFADLASTYDGELDKWCIDEHRRVNKAINNSLIERIA